MLNEKQVLGIVPLSRTSIYRLEKAGKFPRSTYISANRRFGTRMRSSIGNAPLTSSIRTEAAARGVADVFNQVRRWPPTAVRFR